MKKSVYVAVLCFCCILICSSCNKLPALCKKATIPESIAHAEEYTEALKEVAEKYSYILEEEEIPEHERERGAIGRYIITIDERSDIYIAISNDDGIEKFRFNYIDHPINDSKLRNYDETLIHSFVDLANCISGKDFSYEECYEFFQEASSDGHTGGVRSIDFWDSWRVIYSFENFNYGMQESIWFAGNTKLSTW